MGVGLTQLLPQALGQSCHSELGGAVEVYISTVDYTMSAHAATEEDIRVIQRVNQDSNIY